MTFWKQENTKYTPEIKINSLYACETSCSTRCLKLHTALRKTWRHKNWGFLTPRLHTHKHTHHTAEDPSSLVTNDSNTSHRYGTLKIITVTESVSVWVRMQQLGAHSGRRFFFQNKTKQVEIKKRPAESKVKVHTLEGARQWLKVKGQNSERIFTVEMLCDW